MRGAFSPFLFLFVSCHFTSEAQDSLVSVLNYLYFYFGPIPNFKTRYVNTTLYSSFTLTNLFLARKCLVFENLVEYNHLYGSPDVTFFIILTRLYEQQHKTIISAGWQLREARRNQFENVHQFYLTDRCYKNIIERPSYV